MGRPRKVEPPVEILEEKIPIGRPKKPIVLAPPAKSVSDVARVLKLVESEVGKKNPAFVPYLVSMRERVEQDPETNAVEVLTTLCFLLAQAV